MAVTAFTCNNFPARSLDCFKYNSNCFFGFFFTKTDRNALNISCNRCLIDCIWINKRFKITGNAHPKAVFRLTCFVSTFCHSTGLNLIVGVVCVSVFVGWVWVDVQHHCRHSNSCSITGVCLVYLQRASHSLILTVCNSCFLFIPRLSLSAFSHCFYPHFFSLVLILYLILYNTKQIQALISLQVSICAGTDMLKKNNEIQIWVVLQSEFQGQEQTKLSECAYAGCCAAIKIGHKDFWESWWRSLRRSYLIILGVGSSVPFKTW